MNACALVAAGPRLPRPSVSPRCHPPASTSESDLFPSTRATGAPGSAASSNGLCASIRHNSVRRRSAQEPMPRLPRLPRSSARHTPLRSRGARRSPRVLLSSFTSFWLTSFVTLSQRVTTLTASPNRNHLSRRRPCSSSSRHRCSVNSLTGTPGRFPVSAHARAENRRSIEQFEAPDARARPHHSVAAPQPAPQGNLSPSPGSATG